MVYNGINTGYKTIKTGKKTKITADSITDIAIAAASFNKYVSFFSSGISLFKAFNDAFGTPWATAYQGYYNPLTEWMTWKCGSITFTF